MEREKWGHNEKMPGTIQDMLNKTKGPLIGLIGQLDIYSSLQP